MYLNPSLLSILVLIIVFSSCSNTEEKTNETPLAIVFDKYLYPSDVQGIVGNDISPKDSSLIMSSYIENWAKDQLIVSIAEKNIDEALDIDKLVEDYRKSLIRHNYEQALVQQRLDSVVTNDQIIRFYNKAQSQYQLDESILRCFFIKVKKQAPEQKDLKIWWKEREDSDVNKMVDYARKYADKYILDDSSWVHLDDVAAEYPKGTFTESNIKAGLSQIVEKGNFVYYFKVKAQVKAKKVAPLSYVKSKIIKVILHKRKLELLENMTEELYKRELNKKNVKILTQ